MRVYVGPDETLRAGFLATRHIIKLAITRGATYNNFSGQFFHIFEIIIFCFLVAICDLVHDV